MDWWQTALVAFSSATFAGVLTIVADSFRGRSASKQEARTYNRDFQREVLTELQNAVITYSSHVQDASIAQGAGKPVRKALRDSIWFAAMDLFMLSERLAADEIRKLSADLFDRAPLLYGSKFDAGQASDRREDFQNRTDRLQEALGRQFRKLFGPGLP
jgi:hypothetical protein